MNNTHFVSVYVEGFRGIATSLTFFLDQPGLNFVKGVNGAGKTTVFEAVVWAIYGINLKDTNQDKITSWPEIRPPSFQGTKVAVIFYNNDNEYTVARHLGYKGTTADIKGEDQLIVIKNGIIDGNPRNKAEMQDKINAIMGIDAKTFVNSILFGQRMARLIEQDNTDKRKLFDELFETEWIKIAKDRADIRITSISEAVKDDETTITSNEGQITSLETAIDNENTMLVSFEDNKKNRLKQHKENLEKYTQELSGFNQELTEATNKRNQLQFDEEEYTKVNNKIIEIRSSMDHITETINDLDLTITALNQAADNFTKIYKEASEGLVTPDHTEDLARIDGCEAAIEDAEGNIAELQDYAEMDIEEITLKKDNLEKEKIEGELRLTQLKNELSILQAKGPEVASTICSACGASIKDAAALNKKYQKQFNDKVKELETTINEMTESLEGTYVLLEAVVNNLINIDTFHEWEESIIKHRQTITELRASITSKDQQYKIDTLGIQNLKDRMDANQTSIDEKTALRTEKQEAYKVKEEQYLNTRENSAAILELKSQYDAISTTISDIESDIKDCEKDIAVANESIISIDAEEPPVSHKEEYKTKIIKLREAIEDIKTRIVGKQQEKEDLLWWSQKGLSNTGIKAFIFKAMLDRLNENTKKYGERLGVSLEFSIDLDKASRPFTTKCSVKGIMNKEYKEFSGGEKQRLDIALIFAMYDLVSMNTDFNILIMDEVFEGLDEEGEATVFDLIRMKAQEDKSVFIITHSVVMDSLYSNTIEFSKGTYGTVLDTVV